MWSYVEELEDISRKKLGKSAPLRGKRGLCSFKLVVPQSENIYIMLCVTKKSNQSTTCTSGLLYNKELERQ